MIKQIIKKILGRPIQTEPHYIQYIENRGNSVLRPGFSLRVDMPIPDKKYLILGKDSLLSCSVVFESEEGIVKIGDKTSVGGSTIICRNEIIIENNIFISWGCTICDHGFHSLDHLSRREDFDNNLDNVRNYRNINAGKNWDTVDSKPIRICSDAWIGMNSIILKGVTIGRGAIVGAGSVVTKDVPDFTVVAGNPAKVIRTLEIQS